MIYFSHCRLNLQIFSAILVLAGFSVLAQVSNADDIPVVDCHVHLYDINRPEGTTWISKDNKVLYRSILPEHHEPLAKANGVRAVVIVQAGQSLPDNQWNLDFTAKNKQLYRGIVGNLSKVIGTAEFQPLFEKLCSDKRYVGYRLSGRYQNSLTPEFFNDLALTAKKRKTLDILVGDYSLDDTLEIAKRLPELKIILDHFGNVQLSDQPLDPTWVAKIKAVANYKNVYCKVSALYGRVKQQPAPRDLKFYKPVLDLTYDSFGEDRLIFGSDWPVTELTGDYASVITLTKSYFNEKGPLVTKKVFSTNAIRFYSIPEDGLSP